MSKLFFGEYHQIFEFPEDDKIITRESSETFNFIPLDVKEKNLYDALDHHIVSDIEEFKNDKNQNVKARKYNWIHAPP